MAKMPPRLNSVIHWASLPDSTIVLQTHCAVTVEREADKLLV